MDLEERKKALHQEIKATAVALDESYTEEADPEIFSHVAGLSEYERAGALFYFVGTSGGIDTTLILEDALRKGKWVGVSKCTTRGITEVCEIGSPGDLGIGKYGILEPGTETPVIQSEGTSLAIVSYMPCNRDGRRLGYGDEYYDRYLVRTRAVRVVIYREQIMHADIPVEPHDQLVDMVVPKHGVRQLGGR